MKLFSFPRSLAALALGACLIAPASSYADRKVTVYRDRDGDGHYNKKTYDVSNHGHGHGYYGGHYSGGYYGNRYYGSRYYGRPYYYGYRPYSYGYSPYYYSRPSVGISFSTSPSYYSSGSYAYDSYEDNLAADVQQALRRRGYYRGAIDGDIGPGSRSAIRAYQADRGLAVTGRIDRSLLRSLGIG